MNKRYMIIALAVGIGSACCGMDVERRVVAAEAWLSVDNFNEWDLATACADISKTLAVVSLMDNPEAYYRRLLPVAQELNQLADFMGVYCKASDILTSIYRSLGFVENHGQIANEEVTFDGGEDYHAYLSRILNLASARGAGVSVGMEIDT